MPLRYIVFSIFILTAACGASRHIAGRHAEVENTPKASLDAVNAPIGEAKNISGRSIAPGGAGGRQS